MADYQVTTNQKQQRIDLLPVNQVYRSCSLPLLHVTWLNTE